MNSELNTAIKDTGKHGLIYGVGTLAPNLVGFLLLPVFARFLTPAEFGVWALLQVSSEVFSAFLGLGLDTACMRSYFDYEEAEDRKKVIGTTLIILLIIALLFNAVTYFFLENLSFALFKDSGYSLMVGGVVIATTFRIFNAIPLVVFRAKKESKKYIILQSGTLIVRMIIFTYVVVATDTGVYGLVIGDVLITCIASILLYYNIRTDISLKVNRKEFIKQITFGVPIVPSRFFSSAINMVERYFIVEFVSLATLGIYSVGVKIGQVVYVLLGRPFQLIFQATAFSLDKEKYSEEYYKKIFTYFVYLGSFICLCVSLFSYEVLFLMGRQEYLMATNVIPIIAISYLMAGAQLNLQIGVFVQRKTHWVLSVSFVGCLLNICFNFLLVERIGMYGSAISILITRGFMAYALYYISGKYKKINYEWDRCVKVLLISILIYFIGHYLNSTSHILSILSNTCLIVVFPISLYFVGFHTDIEKEKIIATYKACIRKVSFKGI